MNNILLNRIILFSVLLLSAFFVSAEITPSEKSQACVLYGTDKNDGFPIPQESCVEVRLNISCDEKVVDSKSSNKVWRSYPMLACTSPKIKAGLSEQYLLKGVD